MVRLETQWICTKCGRKYRVKPNTIHCPICRIPLIKKTIVVKPKLKK